MSNLIEQLNSQPGIRLQFIRRDDRGERYPYSSESYWDEVLDGETPPDWSKRDLGHVRTKKDTRLAWELTRNDTTVGVVSHETGIEILIGISVGVAGGVGSAAIVKLTKWFFERNKKQVDNTPNKDRVTLSAEVYDNGKYKRLEFNATAEADVIADVRRIIDDFMSK